jgi:Trk-type K+ transport system membrane component
MLAVIGFSFLFEFAIAVVLTLRFWARDDIGFGTATWRGVFHSISAFNNSGFALFSDSMTRYALDPLVLFTIAVAVVAGGLGFPIWLELRRRWRRPSTWSLHAKLTMAMSAILLFGGWILISLLEWGNDQTIGREDGFHKLMSGFFASAASRTAGFNTFDYEQMSDSGVMVTQMLMFAGGGSGSTAGGIKVTTFAVLLLAAIAEIRGAPDVSAFGRRISTPIQRQALTVAFASINVVVIGAVVLMMLTPHEFERVLFEAVSAFATTGLSLNVTRELSGGADFVVILLMYLGRIGPLTLAVALLLRRHPRRFRYPEERPLVG